MRRISGMVIYVLCEKQPVSRARQSCGVCAGAHQHQPRFYVNDTAASERADIFTDAAG